MLKSGPSKGKPWRRKPRLQMRLSAGYDPSFVRRALGIALAMDSGDLELSLEDPNAKPGVPVAAAPNSDAAMEVIAGVAEERGAPLVRVERELSVSKLDSDLSGQSFVIEGLRGTYRLRIPLLGDHQTANAATAIAAVESLPDRYAVSAESIVRGIADVRWSARLEVLSTDGSTLVVDGAHNPHSMGRLVEAVRENFRFDRVILIFGSLTEDVDEGTRRALEMARDGDLVLGTGSLTVAAEIIEHVRDIPPELYPTIKLPPSRGV